jgi:thiamine pyrophosphokinase
MAKKLSADFVFVLVGPLADSARLAKWAHEEFRKTAGVVFVGVDRGTDALVASGLPVSFAIGDFDGSTGVPEEVPSVLLQKEKERSDLSFALRFCEESGAKTLYAYGFQGGRADHEFAVHLDLSEASRRIPRVLSIGERGAFFYLSAKFSPLRLERANLVSLKKSFSAKKDGKKAKKSTPKCEDWFSVFPVAGEARGVKLRGLRFPAAGGILSASSQGVSNVLNSAKIQIGVERGRVAAFYPFEE